MSEDKRTSWDDVSKLTFDERRVLFDAEITAFVEKGRAGVDAFTAHDLKTMQAGERMKALLEGCINMMIALSRTLSRRIGRIFAVAAIIVRFSDNDDVGGCTLSQGTIATMLDIDERAVRLAIRTLVNRGYVLEQRRRDMTSILTPVIPKILAASHFAWHAHLHAPQSPLKPRGKCRSGGDSQPDREDIPTPGCQSDRDDVPTPGFVEYGEHPDAGVSQQGEHPDAGVSQQGGHPDAAYFTDGLTDGQTDSDGFAASASSPSRSQGGGVDPSMLESLPLPPATMPASFSKKVESEAMGNKAWRSFEKVKCSEEPYPPTPSPSVGGLIRPATDENMGWADQLSDSTGGADAPLVDEVMVGHYGSLCGIAGIPEGHSLVHGELAEMATKALQFGYGPALVNEALREALRNTKNAIDKRHKEGKPGIDNMRRYVFKALLKNAHEIFDEREDALVALETKRTKRAIQRDADVAAARVTAAAAVEAAKVAPGGTAAKPHSKAARSAPTRGTPSTRFAVKSTDPFRAEWAKNPAWDVKGLQGIKKADLVDLGNLLIDIPGRDIERFVFEEFEKLTNAKTAHSDKQRKVVPPTQVIDAALLRGLRQLHGNADALCGGEPFQPTGSQIVTVSKSWFDAQVAMGCDRAKLSDIVAEVQTDVRRASAGSGLDWRAHYGPALQSGFEVTVSNRMTAAVEKNRKEAAEQAERMARVRAEHEASAAARSASGGPTGYQPAPGYRPRTPTQPAEPSPKQSDLDVEFRSDPLHSVPF